MPGGTSRALPDLVSRIRVDSSGVDQAITSLIGSIGKADLALAGVAAGLGLLVLGGKSMLDIYNQQQDALSGLKQAVDVHNDSLGTQGRIVVDLTKQESALTVARNGATLAQLSYSDAVKKHGALSQAAEVAALHLQDAHLRLAAAEDALTVAQAKASPGTQQQALDFQKLTGQIDTFIASNHNFISNQSDVVDGYAKLIRAGLNQTEVQRVMNDAIDLAAIKHISLADAVDVLNAAEHGRLKGLIDLGITTKQLVDANGNLLKGQPAIADAMAEVDKKVAHGRDTLSDLQQHTNQLNNDWQTLSQRGGPVILTLLDAIVTGATDVYGWFDAIGHNNGLWAAISGRLVDMGKWLKQYVIDPIQWLTDHIPSSPGSIGGRSDSNTGSNPTLSSISGPPLARAGGGPVNAGGVYTVGENVPETLVIGPNGGGFVTPNGGTPRAPSGGDNLSVTVNAQTDADPQEIARDAAWELRKLRRAF